MGGGGRAIARPTAESSPAATPWSSGGVESVVPVDLHIRGCPPRPAELLKGLLALLEPEGAQANAPEPVTEAKSGSCDGIQGNSVLLKAQIPDRRSREGGDPFPKPEQALKWAPAFARATLRLSSARLFAYEPGMNSRRRAPGLAFARPQPYQNQKQDGQAHA